MSDPTTTVLPLEGTIAPPPPAPPPPVDDTPPTWAEVTQSPGFSTLPPEKQLVTFSRWHDDVFNHLSAQPDWEQHKEEFNKRAAQAEARLSKAAGGISPVEAKAGVAQSALDSAGASNNADIRATLGTLPPDLMHAYYDHKISAALEVPPADDHKFHLETQADGQQRYVRHPAPGVPTEAPTQEEISATPHAPIANAWEKIKQFFSPLTGPTEQQLSTEAVPVKGKDGSTTYVYKPGSGAVEQEGLLPALNNYLMTAGDVVNLPRVISLSLQGKDITPANLDAVRQQEHASMDLAPSPDDSLLAAATKGVASSLLNTAETFANPAVLAVPQSRLLQLGFGTQMIAGARDALKQIATAPDPQTAIEDSLNAASSLILGKMALEHGVNGTLGKAIKELPTPEPTAAEKNAEQIKANANQVAQQVAAGGAPKTAAAVQESGQRAAEVAAATPVPEVNVSIDKNGNRQYTQNLPEGLTPEQLASHDEAVARRVDLPEEERTAFRQAIADAKAKAEERFAPPKSTAEQKAEELKNLSGLGRGAVSSMYDMMFGKLQKGDLTEAGGPSRALQLAYPEFQAGRIKSAEDLQRFFNPEEPKAITAAEAPKSTPSSTTIKFATEAEAQKFHTDNADRFASFTIAHSSKDPTRTVTYRFKPEAEKPKIVGPVLTDKDSNVLAEGKAGVDTHAGLVPAAFDKQFNEDPANISTTLLHQFRDSEGNILSRAQAWKLAKDAGQIKPEVLKYKDGPKATLQSQDLVTAAKQIGWDAVSAEDVWNTKGPIDKPVIAYHGTPTRFEKFDVSKGWSGNQGLHFAVEPAGAKGYAGKEGQVHKVELDIKNPLRTTSLEVYQHMSKAEVDALKAKGYDGVFIDDPNSGVSPGVRTREIVAFSPDQVRMAPSDEVSDSPAGEPPTKEELDALVAKAAKENPRSDEEKAKQIETGTKAAYAYVGKTGLLPDFDTLHRATGSTAAAKQVKETIQKRMAEKWPPAPIPEGAKVTTTKYGGEPKKGNKVPASVAIKSLTYPADEKGVARVEPYFTNDPAHEARALASGVRTYVPDEMIAALNPKTGKRETLINPAIEPYLKYDHAKDQYYVGGVDTNVGHVDKPDTEAGQGESYQERLDRAQLKRNPKAQKGVTLDPEKLQAVKDTVAEEIKARGLDESQFEKTVDPDQLDEEIRTRGGADENDEISPEETPDEKAPPEGVIDEEEHADNLAKGEEDSWSPRPKGLASPASVKQYFQDLAELGLFDKANEFKIETAVQRMAEDKTLDASHRELARLILNSRVDLKQLQSIIEEKPYEHYAARYNGGLGTIRSNLAVIHEGGAKVTLLHEVVHHVVDKKITLDFHRNPVEEKAFQNIKRIYETAKSQLEAKGIAKDRSVYGLTNIKEFVAEMTTNKKFANHIDQLEGTPTSGGRFSKLVQLFKQSLKNLIAGREVRPQSLLDEALEHIFTFVSEGEARAENSPFKGTPSQIAAFERRLAESVSYSKGVDLSTLKRPELEKLARKAGVDDSEMMTMTSQELRDAIGGVNEKPAETAVKQVQGDGWISPDGKTFYRAEPPDIGRVRGVDAPIFGGHEEAAMKLIDADPALSKAFGAYLKKLGKNVRDVDTSEISAFMQDHGFLRVVNSTGTTFFTGDPKKNPEGVNLLMNHAIEHERFLVHDRETGRGGQRELYTPDVSDSPAGEEEKEPEAKLIEKDSKHFGLKLSPEATKEQVAGLRKLIDEHPAMPEGVREALHEQIELTVAQGDPVMVDQARGKELIVSGHNAFENIANTVSRQKANEVGLDFAKGKAGLKDRTAMPFVIEAGGNKEELVRDLNQIANSKNKALADKYVPVLEHAINNFDRLQKLRGTHDKIMRDQLGREQTYGIATGELENYVTRILEAPEAPPGELVAIGSSGKNRYFAKGRTFEKLADAIKEGFIPKTTDLVDLDQRRIEAGERIVQQKILAEHLKGVTTPDGHPIVETPESYDTLYKKDQTRVPKGYVLISTGGAPLIVHHTYAPLFENLYAHGSPRTFFAKYTQFAKKNTLMFDTFHVGRVLFKQLFYSKGAERLGLGDKGVSILEYAPKDLAKALEAGVIDKATFDYATKNHALVAELTKSGLNIAKNSDNLWAEHTAALPGVNKFNSWVFGKLSRGAMVQTAVANFERNMKRFPELGREGNLLRTAKETNEIFGNLKAQSVFKSKNYQNVMRAIFLAPNWAESQLISEFRGYGQIGRAVTDAAQGKFRLGTVAQGQISAAVGMFAAIQVASLLMNGHSTFGNKDKRYFELFLPLGRNGMWFSPLEIAGEYAFMAHRYIGQHMTAPDIAQRILFNKLSPVGRGGTEYILNRDYSGKAFQSQTDRTIAGVTDAIPLPIPLSPFVERDPRQILPRGDISRPSTYAGLGYRANRQPGSIIKQGIQAAGFKLAMGQSPRSQVYELAHPFRQDKGYADNAPPAYRDLRSALDNDNEDAVKSEIRLLARQGHTEQQIKAAVGIQTSGAIKDETFAGSAERERAFKHALTPDQRKLYTQAQADHKANARQFLKLYREERAANPQLTEQMRKNKKPVY